MKEVCNFLDNYLTKKDTIILGCSGGPDSMCLLSLLEKNYNVNIVVAHVNHSIREESNVEYDKLKEYCEHRHLIFEGFVLEKISKNFESEARKKRYEFFEKLYHKYNAKCIMTAHHGDDLIETILMRITRGSNLSGYAGLKVIDEHYVRPLLYVTKDEIENYNKNNNVCYFIDYTNNLDEHTRNRYRHKVLPFLKTEDKLVHKKYMNYSKELLDYDKFVNNYISKLNIIKNNSVNLQQFNKEEDFIKRKIIELIIKNLQRDYYFDVSNKNVEDILLLANSKRSNVSIDLPNGFKATKSYNNLYIEYAKKSSDYHIIYNGKWENDDWIIKDCNNNDDNSNFTIFLNSKEIKMPIVIRNRNNGDVIHLKIGTKKLKDVFIDEKIDISKRNSWPIISDSEGNILLVPGIKKSKFAKDKSEKYDIILKCERKKYYE